MWCNYVEEAEAAHLFLSLRNSMRSSGICRNSNKAHILLRVCSYQAQKISAAIKRG